MKQECRGVVKAARRLKLKCKKKQGIAYGVYQDYTFAIYKDKYARTPKYYISFCVSRDGSPMRPELLQELPLPEKVFCVANGYRINMILMAEGSSRKIARRISDSVKAAAEYMRANLFFDCDEKGVVAHPAVYIVEERICFLHDESVDDNDRTMLYDSMRSNMIHRFEVSQSCRKAILVTLFFSIVCAVFLYFLVRMFDIMAVAGLVLGIVSMGCYLTLDKHNSYLGLLVCGILNILLLYLMFRIYVATDLVQICEEWRRQVTFRTCFFHPKAVLDEYSRLSDIAQYEYNQLWYGTLGVYIFTVIIYCQVCLDGRKEEEEERQKHERYKLD